MKRFSLFRKRAVFGVVSLALAVVFLPHSALAWQPPSLSDFTSIVTLGASSISTDFNDGLASTWSAIGDGAYSLYCTAFNFLGACDLVTGKPKPTISPTPPTPIPPKQPPAPPLAPTLPSEQPVTSYKLPRPGVTQKDLLNLKNELLVLINKGSVSIPSYSGGGVGGVTFIQSTSPTTPSGGETSFVTKDFLSGQVNAIYRSAAGNYLPLSAVSSLISCDTIDTDAKGNFVCGTDASGVAVAGAAFAWTPTSWGVSTSTTLGFLNGFLSTASSTITDTLRLSSLSSGSVGIGTGGLLYSAATTTFSGGLTYSSGNVTVTADGITDTELAFNTGQNLTTASSPTFAGLTLSSALTVANGGTGAATFGQGWLHSAGGTSALTSSTSPTVNYVTATSTTATSTFAGGLSIGTTGSAPGLAVLSNATSTFAQGINIAAGCFSVNGTCLPTTSGSGGNSKWATSTTDSLAIYPTDALRVGIGTTTPQWGLQIASTTGPQFALTDQNAGTNLKHWTMRSAGGNLYIATSSDVFATSTIAAVTVTPNGWLGVGTTSPSQSFSTAGNLYIGGTGTSTNAGNENIQGTGINFNTTTRWYQAGAHFMTSSSTSAGNLAIGYQSASGLDESGGSAPPTSAIKREIQPLLHKAIPRSATRR